MSVEEAEELVEEIESMADDFPSEGEHFSESCRDKARDIMDTIDEYGSATDAQIQALRNMRDGMRKWFRD